MSVRVSSRKLTGSPVHRVDTYVGVTPEGDRQATVWAYKYRAQPIPLRDPELVRQMIDDLGGVLAYLEDGTLPEAAS